jgi:hypothetical protein
MSRTLGHQSYLLLTPRNRQFCGGMFFRYKQCPCLVKNSLDRLSLSYVNTLPRPPTRTYHGRSIQRMAADPNPFRSAPHCMCKTSNEKRTGFVVALFSDFQERIIDYVTFLESPKGSFKSIYCDTATRGLRCDRRWVSYKGIHGALYLKSDLL